MSACYAKKQCVFSQMPAEAASFTGKEQLIRFVLKLLERDLSTGVGLQMCVELIVLLHTPSKTGDAMTSGTRLPLLPESGSASV